MASRDIVEHTVKGNEFTVTVCEEHGLEYCHRCMVDFSEMNIEAKRVAESKDELLCNAPGCQKKYAKICSKCHMAKYCSQECQRAHWAEHKKLCGRSSSSSTGPLRLNLAVGPEGPDKFVDLLPIDTKLKLLTGRADGNVRGKIVGFNKGKGPYADPSVRFNPRSPEHKAAFGSGHFDDDEMFCTYSIKVKGSDEVWKVECGEVHHSWIVVGKQDEEGDESNTANSSSSSTADPLVFTYPSDPKFLLVSSLGYFSSKDCFYCKALRAVLDARGLPYDAIDFSSAEDLSQRLSSGKYSACVMLGLGSSGPAIMKDLSKGRLKQTAVSWVEQGGRLIFQGEGSLGVIFQEWFGFSWAFSGYYRCQQLLGRCENGHAIPPFMLPQMNIMNYSAKCCYLTGVDPGYKLFTPEDNPAAASAAAASIGTNKGRIAFFGDVNAEEVTVSAMVAMGTGL